ncbi:MAG: alpha/beta hydrolase [Sphingomonadaceae bacterium]
MTNRSRRSQNIWIETEAGFMGAAWYWPQSDAALSTVVVLVPGIAHEERTMAGGVAALAESLADAGMPTLLIDLHGCSQSAGQIGDIGIGARWHANIRAAMQHARDTGAARVIVAGVRLGFLIAAEALQSEALAGLIAWAPIAAGRRYVRELKMLQRAADTGASGSIAIAGFSLPASLLEYISELDVSKIGPLKTSSFLLRDMPDGLKAPWLGELAQTGVKLDAQASHHIQPWLFSATDQPQLPHEDIQALASWCAARHRELAAAVDPIPRRPEPSPTIMFVHQGHLVRETFVEIGEVGLTGVMSEPAHGANNHGVRLLMSTVGPGRTFTDFARDEASRGNMSLRFDFSGFGTSGRGNTAQGGELYTRQGAQDVQAAFEYLRRAGHQQVYGLGFCAGAWSMMEADAASRMRAVVAINVALYHYPGPEAPKIIKRLRRILASFVPGFRTNLLRLGVATRARRTTRERSIPLQWLVRLCSSDARVLLAYAERDPGLEYLSGQIAMGLHEELHRPFVLQTYKDLGHLAEGTSARARLFDDIASFFADLDREALTRRQRRSSTASATHAPRRRRSARRISIR